MRISVNDTELYIDVDGSELAPTADGLTTRPTVVALHGGPGFDQGYLRPAFAQLRDDAQVIFPDLRGQGRSARPSVDTCTLEQMADDVAALCRTLGLVAPVVFGHSAGGFVGLHLALRHPEAVGGLALCNTAPTLAPMHDEFPPPSLAERSSPEAAAVAARLFGGDFTPETMDSFARLVLPHYAGPQHPDVPPRMMALSGFAPEVAGYFFGVLAPRYDLLPRLAEICTPTLVIVGGYDWVCPPVCGRAIAAGIPGADLLEIPEAGHFSFAEEQPTFLAAIRGFLRRTTAPSTSTRQGTTMSA